MNNAAANLTPSQRLAIEDLKMIGTIAEVFEMDGRHACIRATPAGMSGVRARYGAIGPTGKITFNN